MSPPINDVLYASFKVDNSERSLAMLMLRQSDNILAQELTGSRAICNPPPMDTDLDVIVLVKDLFAFIDDSQKTGWTKGGSKAPDIEDTEFDDCHFVSITSGKMNLIVTKRKTFYERFVAATERAKRLNLMHKPCRISLFRAFRYDL